MFAALVLLIGSTALRAADLSATGAGPPVDGINGEDSAASQIERDGALITPPVLRPGEGLASPPIGGLIAYSLKSAQARVLAFGDAHDWRKRDPELFTLAGITRPEGLIVDRSSGDVILVGRAAKGDAPLTLDDFVVALRARLIDGRWPVASIDPEPGHVMQEGDPQTVRFEGGIQNTQFGADLLDADHRLKKMGFGLLPTGVPGLRSIFDRRLDEGPARDEGHSTQIGARLWFQPVQDRVIVRDDVVQLGPMTVSVFTELLSVSIDGKALDPKTFHDETTDAFARDISNRFDDVARANPTVARVRGLNGIVAVVAGMERIVEMPSLDYWLHQYAVRIIRTPKAVRVLRRDGRTSAGSPLPTLYMEGGVELQAIALALQSGDVSALRRAVLATRPRPTTLSWRLVVGQWVIPLSRRALPLTAIGPLYAQAAFLSTQRRWDDVIAVLNAGLCIAGNHAADSRRGAEPGLANADSLPPSPACPSVTYSGAAARAYLSLAFFMRAVAYDSKGSPDDAIHDYGQAIGLNPRFVEALTNRGFAYDAVGQHDRATQDFDEAIRIDPSLAVILNYRRCSGDDEQTARSPKVRIQACTALIEVARLTGLNLVASLGNRGTNYARDGEYDLAIQDYSRAIELDPGVANLFLGRGGAYALSGQMDQAILNYDQAIQIEPTLAAAFACRSLALRAVGRQREADEDFARAKLLDPKIE